jgi:enoyl-[acyl-carrier-protein] reductase (NADH)
VGEEFVSFAEQFKLRGQFVNRDDVANTIVALCSGLLDGVRGQVITVDRGAAFFDNLMRLYQERDAFDVGVHSNLE